MTSHMGNEMAGRVMVRNVIHYCKASVALVALVATNRELGMAAFAWRVLMVMLHIHTPWMQNAGSFHGPLV